MFEIMDTSLVSELADRIVHDWSGWVLASAASTALLSDILAGRRNSGDDRIDYIADFLGVQARHVIPLPPATALWSLYAQRNALADPDAELPPGSPTLKASYLVFFRNGAAVLCVHNMDSARLIPDPDIEDGLLACDGYHDIASGTTSPTALPMPLEEDAVKRADIVDYLLKEQVRYAGAVSPFIILRDEGNRAPPAEIELTCMGKEVERLSFSRKQQARDAMARISGGGVPDRAVFATWIKRWAGNTTSKRRRIWRLGLLVLGVSIGLFGGPLPFLEVFRIAH